MQHGTCTVVVLKRIHSCILKWLIFALGQTSSVSFQNWLLQIKNNVYIFNSKFTIEIELKLSAQKTTDVLKFGNIFTVVHCIFFQGKAHQHQTKLCHHLHLHLIRIHQHTLPKDHQKSQSSQVDLCRLNSKSYHQKSLLQTNLLVVFQDSFISPSPQHFSSHLLIQVELPLLAVSL